MKKLLTRATLFITVILLAACSQPKASFNSVDITGANYAQDFSLPDVNGQIKSIKDFAGKVVWVFFGYTQCPDVCPTTMAEVASIKQALNKEKPGLGDQLQVVFITIDPERDTAPVLNAYVHNFDTSFVALRPTSPEMLAEAAKSFKVYYKKVDGPSPTAYSMDHTAASYIFDPKGHIRLFTRYGTDQELLKQDIKQLLSGI